MIYSGLFAAEAKLVNSELFFEAELMLPRLPVLLDFDVGEKIEGHNGIEFFAVGYSKVVVVFTICVDQVNLETPENMSG